MTLSDTSLVADVLAEIQRQVSGQSFLWPMERDAIVRTALERLKDAPSETAIEFALAGLRLMQDRQSWLSDVLNHAVGGVLRRKLAVTEDQVLQMIELVSREHREFPYRGILKAVESLPMTPGLADALRRLRPWINEFLGGSEARDLHARIDNLLSGPRPETSLAIEGAWSQIVFKHIAESPQRSVWERIFAHATELKSSEAPKKWRAAAQQLIEELGQAVFLDAAARWLALGPSPGRTGVQISSGEASYQTGFLWLFAGQTDERLPGLHDREPGIEGRSAVHLLHCRSR